VALAGIAGSAQMALRLSPFSRLRPSHSREGLVLVSMRLRQTLMRQRKLEAWATTNLRRINRIFIFYLNRS
jgi:hypothetical protein